MTQIAFPTTRTIWLQSKEVFLEVKGEINYFRALGHQEGASLLDVLGIGEVAGQSVRAELSDSGRVAQKVCR